MTTLPGRCSGDDASVRLDLNESAFGPLPAVAEVLRDQIPEVNRYPDFRPERTREIIAAHLGVAAGQVTIGAGATGVAASILHSCGVGIRHPAVVTAVPTFDGYPILARLAGLRFDAVGLGPGGAVDLAALFDAVGADTVAVVICSPHNPTGSVVDEEQLHRFLAALPARVTVVLDEAYGEFAEHGLDLRRLIRRHRRLVVVRTFSKAYGLAALRVGYGVGAPEAIAPIRDRELPFAVGTAALAAVPIALAAQHELAHRVGAMRAERNRLAAKLASIGVTTFRSEGNFLFLPGVDGIEIGGLLRGCGVATKQCGDDGVRITVGDRASTNYVIDALRATALIA